MTRFCPGNLWNSTIIGIIRSLDLTCNARNPAHVIVSHQICHVCHEFLAAQSVNRKITLTHACMCNSWPVGDKTYISDGDDILYEPAASQECSNL